MTAESRAWMAVIQFFTTVRILEIQYNMSHPNTTVLDWTYYISDY